MSAQDDARWEAFAALHPSAELDRDPGCHNKRYRGRLAPGLPWTDWGWSTDRVVGELERMTGAGGVIHLWSAGSASGTAGSIAAVLEVAAGDLAAGAVAVVEEAEVEMHPAGVAGAVPEYRRTGRAWRLRVLDGAPSWGEPAKHEPEALAG